MDKKDLNEDYGKNKYKLHYIYREFTMDFFSMALTTLPQNCLLYTSGEEDFDQAATLFPL